MCTLKVTLREPSNELPLPEPLAVFVFPSFSLCPGQYVFQQFSAEARSSVTEIESAVFAKTPTASFAAISNVYPLKIEYSKSTIESDRCKFCGWLVAIAVILGLALAYAVCRTIIRMIYFFATRYQEFPLLEESEEARIGRKLTHFERDTLKAAHEGYSQKRFFVAFFVGGDEAGALRPPRVAAESRAGVLPQRSTDYNGVASIWGLSVAVTALVAFLTAVHRALECECQDKCR